MDLREEILRGPNAQACAPFVVTNDMPKAPNCAEKDQAIADILNAHRPPSVGRREVGDGAIALALGMPAGPVFLYRLKQIAATQLPADAPIEQIAPVAVAQQVVSSLARSSFDVGDDEVRKGIDLFVGVLLNADQAIAIKALAPNLQSVVTAAAVSRALRGPWE